MSHIGVGKKLNSGHVNRKHTKKGGADITIKLSLINRINKKKVSASLRKGYHLNINIPARCWTVVKVCCSNLP